MKLSEVYRTVAKMYEDGNPVDGGGSCRCLAYVSHGGNGWKYTSNYVAVRQFQKYFEPIEAGPYWWPMNNIGHQERILALCFMAAIAESEGQ